MENNNPEEKVIIKYSSYTPAQKRATQKYRQNNKEKVNEQRKKYYLSRKEKDPQFLEYKRQKAKEYYQRKKASKEVVPEVFESVVESVVEPLIEQQEKTQEPEIIDTVEVKPKKKRSSKKKEVLENIAEASGEEKPKKKRASKKSLIALIP